MSALDRQGFVRERLKEIILGVTERGAALPDSIPHEDRAMIADMIRVQMDSLYPGRAAPLGVTSNDIDNYLRKLTVRTQGSI